MIRTRLKLLGLCAVVLGVMAVSAASAQAKPEWMVNGANITTNTLLPQVQIKEIELLGEKTEAEKVRHLVLLTTILKIKTEILCTGAELVGAKLAAEGKLTEGKVKFTGCKSILNGVENKECVPKTGGKTGVEGTVETELGLGEIVLHILKNEKGEEIGKDTLTLIHPSPVEGKVSEKFVTLEMKEACPIGEKVPIIGELFLKDSNGKAEVEEVTHLIAQGPLTALWAISKTEEHVANIDGSAIVALIGTGHLGLKWSGLAA